MPGNESPPTSGWPILGRWPLRLEWVWLAVPLFGVLIRISVSPIAPNDYWWHLAASKFAQMSGRLLDANYFLYTLPADASFLNQPWLSQHLMYRGWEVGGHIVLALGRNVLALVTWLGVVAVGVTRCRDLRVFSGFAMLTVAVSGAVFAVRTQMIALPIFVAGLGLVVLVADNRIGSGWLWLLVPVTALWANLHGSFVLMPALTGVVGAGLYAERWWRGADATFEGVGHWVGATIVMLAAGCLNPHGWEVYRYVVQLAVLSSVPETVTEWQPPDPTEPVGAAIIGGLVVSTAILIWRWREVRWWEAVLFVVTGWMAATSLRSIFWWEAAALWIVPRHLTALLGIGGVSESVTEPGWFGGMMHGAVVAGLALATVLVQPGMPGFAPVVKAGVEGAKTSGEGALVLNDKHPLELVDTIHHASRKKDRVPRVFHHQAVGGLLAFHLGFDESRAGTRRVAFVDQRMAMIPSSVWADYFALSKAKSGWRDIVRHHHIDWMLLYEPGDEDADGEQLALLEAVSDSPSWHRRGETDRWHLFHRDGPVGVRARGGSSGGR